MKVITLAKQKAEKIKKISAFLYNKKVVYYEYTTNK